MPFWHFGKAFMIVEAKKTTVAYRCPHCGAGIMSMVDVFTLGADMVKLKCDCGQSEMTIVRQADGKIRLGIPCIACPKPHGYLLSPSVFFGKEEFYLQCPYTNLNIGFVGEQNHVKAELARSELELLDLLEKNGISDLSELRGEDEADDSENDPEMKRTVLFVLGELEAENKIYCRCNGGSPERFEYESVDGGIRVRCRECGAEKTVSADNRLETYAFIDADSLQLE